MKPIRTIKVRKHYLEGENTANEEQHDEDQAHVTESSNLLFVGEVIRLHVSQKNISSTKKESLDSGGCDLTSIMK